MSCRICGRSDCTESFHSIKEQERYEETEDGKLVLREQDDESEAKDE